MTQEVAVVLGAVDVARVKSMPMWPGVTLRPAAITNFREGGGKTMSASFPVDDVCQARTTWNVGGWG